MRLSRMAWPSRSRDRRRRQIASRKLIISMIPISIVVIAAVSAPILPYGAEAQDLQQIGVGPSVSHLLGTDTLGRDVLARLAYGARISLLVALWAAGVATLIGVGVGALSAMSRRLVDTAITRTVDSLYAFPDLLVAVLVGSVATAAVDSQNGAIRLLGQINLIVGGLAGVLLALLLTSWLTTARLVRAKVLSIKGQPYVDAARLAGASRWHLLRRHLLPHCVPTVIVAVTVAVPNAIILEAGLSFLGLGAQPPTPSWGLLLADGVNSIESYPHLLIIPAVALAVLLCSFTTLGQSLAERLEPSLATPLIPRRPASVEPLLEPPADGGYGAADGGLTDAVAG